MAVRGMISCFIYLSPSIMFAHGAADDSKSADASQFLAHRRLHPNTTNGTAAVDEVNVSSQALAYCANGNKYEDCGYWGISQSECESLGCCYTEHIGNGQKKCYPRSGSHPTPPPTPPTPDCARGNMYKDCGYWGITRQQCQALGCCYTENIGSMQKKCYPPA